MSIPTHNISCITKIFPTNCPACNEAVFFFNCTCGTKLYFDYQGYPWEPHLCKKYLLKQQIDLIKFNENYSDEEIYQKITAIER